MNMWINQLCKVPDFATAFWVRKLFGTFEEQARNKTRTVSIIYKGRWLWNPTKFFVVYFCSIFRPWPCAKHNTCLLRTEDLANRNVLVTKFTNQVFSTAPPILLPACVPLLHLCCLLLSCVPLLAPLIEYLNHNDPLELCSTTRLMNCFKRFIDS